MAHDVTPSDKGRNRSFHRLTAAYMRWYGAPIPLESKVGAATNKTTPEATVDTFSTKWSVAYTLAQSVSLRQITCWLTIYDKIIDARWTSCKATDTRCERAEAPTWARGENALERNAREEASFCRVETSRSILLIPLSKDAVGIFGVALEVGVGGITETWSREDAVMFEIVLVLGRRLKQKERIE